MFLLKKFKNYSFNQNNDLAWKALFFAVFFGMIAFLYYATSKIDYVWRWNRVPAYFLYEDNVEVKSEIEGRVEKITVQGEKAFITVKNTYEEESYETSIKNGDIIVDEDDFVYIGDILSEYKKWQIGLLLEGLYITLKVSIIAIFFGTILGLFGGLARISSNPALRWAAITYVEFIRGSPLLVQIFIWYFVLGTLINTFLAQYNIQQLPPLWYGVAALAFFTGAYVVEMVRAGIQSVNKGQTEAARSLGMTKGQAMRYVILPQAMRRILPPLAGQFISLVKDSSLLGIIAIRELTKATREIIASSLQPFEFWFTCAFLYLLLTFSLSMLAQYIERRFLVQ
jgi:polar amino acid transport system permease protein